MRFTVLLRERSSSLPNSEKMPLTVLSTRNSCSAIWLLNSPSVLIQGTTRLAESNLRCGWICRQCLRARSWSDRTASGRGLNAKARPSARTSPVAPVSGRANAQCSREEQTTTNGACAMCCISGSIPRRAQPETVSLPHKTMRWAALWAHRRDGGAHSAHQCGFRIEFSRGRPFPWGAGLGDRHLAQCRSLSRNRVFRPIDVLNVACVST